MRPLSKMLLLGAGISLSSAKAISQTSEPFLPSQLATAKTAFLGFAGAPPTFANEGESIREVYSSVYQALQGNGRLQFVTHPADAELAMELSVSRDERGATPGITVTISDVKTHVILWTLVEPVRTAARAKSAQKNLDDASARIAADLVALQNGNVGNSPVKP